MNVHDIEFVECPACYALEATQDNHYQSPGGPDRVPVTWPIGWAWKWWKPKDRRQNLVRAGALIAAEIERLDRAAGPQADVACPQCGGSGVIEPASDLLARPPREAAEYERQRQEVRVACPLCSGSGRGPQENGGGDASLR